jgi:hypothetical protein
MNEGKGIAPKQWYTRIMDAYRYSPVRLPLFNLAARTALRLRAESDVRRVEALMREKNTETKEWFNSRNVFFGFGIYRSGTTFLADLLARGTTDAAIHHEANVNDYWFYAQALRAPEKTVDHVVRYRLAEAMLRTAGHPATYGEVNPFLRRHAAALIETLPHARYFHVVRDPRQTVRSLMSREIFGPKDPMAAVIFPPDDDPLLPEWHTLGRFGQVCWLWAADNRYLRTTVQHTFKFEEILCDEGAYDRLTRHLRLETEPEIWAKRAQVVVNDTPRRAFAPYAEWISAQKKTFDRICGPEMAYYGY